MPELLYELVSLLAKETVLQAELSKWVLSLRYSHKHNMPSLLAFAVLLLATTHPTHPRQPNFATLEQLLRLLLLQADYHSTLLIYAKLLPLLQWAEGRTQKEVEEALGAPFREFTRPQSWSGLGVGLGKEGGKEGEWEGRKCMGQLLSLLRLLEARNYFLFYFSLINGTGDALENDIDCYFLQLSSSGLQEEGAVSSSQLAILQRNVEHEYGKLRKRKYQQEVVESAYLWLEAEADGLLVAEDKGQLAMEVLAQVVRSQSNLAGATLLQVLDACVESMEAGRVRLFLELVDGCVLEGSFRIATQAILFLVCTVFGKIRKGKLRVAGEAMMEHLLLWKEAAMRRQLPVKLLICLIEWLPFLYQTPLPKQQDPQILQLYRKEILRLARGEGSELSELRVMVEELEHRKMEAVYLQLEEFHSQMEHPEHPDPLHSAKTSHLHFHFRASVVSGSNSQINSLLDSLHSLEQARSHHAQLEIISKSQRNGSFASIPSQRSIRECVEIIMSLIDLFDFRVRELSLADRTHTTNRPSSHPTSYPSSLSNPVDLPVISTHQALTEEQKSELEASGEVRINASSYSEEAKRRLAKGRGLIVRDQCMEVGYQFDSREARLRLYITFLQPVSECSLHVRENSFKLKGQKEAVFTEPRLNKQFQMASTVSHVKLYSLQGVPNSERTVRSRLHVTFARNRKQTEELYDIPVALYSLLEPLPPPPYLQLPEPFLYTSWHQVCPKFAKHGYEYISKFLQCRRDNKGNYLLQCQLMGQRVAARVMVVQGAVRVEAQGKRVAAGLVAGGLLEVLL